MNQRIMYHTSSERYASIEVIQHRQKRYLRFGPRGGWQGALDETRPHRPVFPYQRAFRTLMQSLPMQRRFLSVGVGTGTSLRTVQGAFPDCDLYGVEIDQTVVDIAIRYFESPSHAVADYWIGDGIAFLCNVDLTFDSIFVDAYNTNQIYAPVLDPAFATVLHAALSQQGVAVCNVIARHPLTGRTRAFIEAASKLFPSVTILPVGNPLLDQNLLVVFAKQPQTVASWMRTIRQAEWVPFWERWTWPMRVHVLPNRTPVL